MGVLFLCPKGGAMKKIITYTVEQVAQLNMLLNAVSVTGIQNARQLAAVAQILDLGIPGEIKEPEREGGEG